MFSMKSKLKSNNLLARYLIIFMSRDDHLSPRCSMISVARVERLFFSKAANAAFLRSAEATIQPRTIGFLYLNENKEYSVE